MRRFLGYWCPSMPDGPLIPPHALYDPCGKDVPVWADEAIGDGQSGDSPSTQAKAIGPERAHQS